MSDVIYDEILGKLRTDEGGGGGGGGTSYVFDATQFTVSGDSVSITGTVPSAEVASGVEASAVDYRLTVSSGAASFNPYANIVNATGATVTLKPDTAYKIQATTSAVTLDATVPPSGQWAYEGHAEIFVAGTGYVHTTSNVVLANALEPDAVNNCTVRFHDGFAIISVEDHVAGYIVVNASTSGAGSLAYGLSTATNEYISIDASLNGTTIDLAGATTYACEKHVVGNGYTETILSGGITCTSKTTFSNLSMNGVAVNGGTMTLGDVCVPAGGTVFAPYVTSTTQDRWLDIENVNGDGGVIDLSGTDRVNLTSASISGVTICNAQTTNNTTAGYGVFRVMDGASAVFSGCTLTGFKRGNSTNVYGVVAFVRNASAAFSSCTFIDNDGAIVTNVTNNGSAKVIIQDCQFTNTAWHDVLNAGSPNTTIEISGSTFEKNCILYINNGDYRFSATNSMKSIVYPTGGTGSVIFSSGAILDLTGNTNTTTINPGGGVIVDGGLTVITSAGATVSIAGGTYTKIKNDGTTN